MNLQKVGDKIQQVGVAVKAIFGLAFMFLCLAIGIYGAWWLWPTGITQVPLSSLTLGMIGSALGSIFAPLIALAIGAAALER